MNFNGFFSVEVPWKFHRDKTVEFSVEISQEFPRFCDCLCGGSMEIPRSCINVSGTLDGASFSYAVTARYSKCKSMLLSVICGSTAYCSDAIKEI